MKMRTEKKTEKVLSREVGRKDFQDVVQCRKCGAKVILTAIWPAKAVDAVAKWLHDDDRMCAECRKTKKGGFTLIELLAVLAIMGIVTSIVLFAWPSSKGGAVGKAAREMQSVLRQARQSAISGNCPVAVIVLDAQGKSQCPAICNNAGMVELERYAVVDLFHNTFLKNWSDLPNGAMFVPLQCGESGAVNVMTSENRVRVVDQKTGVVYTYPGIVFHANGQVGSAVDTTVWNWQITVAEKNAWENGSLRAGANVATNTVSRAGNVRCEG
jgi:prepilin-type N-terminal cleavage/methylation domain-containing protein